MSKKFLTFASLNQKAMSMQYTLNTRISANVSRTSAYEALVAEIRQHPLMTTEEEVEAFTALAKAKSEEERVAIKRKIANANLRFVLSVAKKYATDGDKIAELVSLGTIGLYRAIDVFDLSLGFKFISQAVHWIRAEFSEFFRTDANIVRRSNGAKIGSKDLRLAEKFFQEEHREPTEDEMLEMLSKEYGLDLKNKVDVLRVRTNSISERVGGEEDDATVEDTGEFAMVTASRNGAEDEMDAEQNKYLVKKVMSVLTIREQEIISRYYGIDREAQDSSVIAEEFGLCEERIRQLVTRDIPEKIRKAVKGKHLAV